MYRYIFYFVCWSCNAEQMISAVKESSLELALLLFTPAQKNESGIISKCGIVCFFFTFLLTQVLTRSFQSYAWRCHSSDVPTAACYLFISGGFCVNFVSLPLTGVSDAGMKTAGKEICSFQFNMVSKNTKNHVLVFLTQAFQHCAKLTEKCVLLHVELLMYDIKTCVLKVFILFF